MKIYNKSYDDYNDRIFKNLIKIKENNKNFEKVSLDKINKYDINNTNRSNEIYIFPINLNLNYKNDYNIEIVNGSNLYFVLVQEQVIDSTINELSKNILYTILFSFISVSFLNFIIWIVISSCFFFYFKAIFAPLKKIHREFNKLLFVNEKNHDNDKKNHVMRKSTLVNSRCMRIWHSNIKELFRYNEIFTIMHFRHFRI